jgi:hypothetical protein
MSRFATVLTDRYWYRMPDGSLVQRARHEAQREDGVHGGRMAYPAVLPFRATPNWKSEDTNVRITEDWWRHTKHPLINSAEAAHELPLVSGG